jgi:hypothetical protein
MPEDLITRLYDEAALCRNEGADDIAKLLEEAAQVLEECALALRHAVRTGKVGWLQESAYKALGPTS